MSKVRTPRAGSLSLFLVSLLLLACAGLIFKTLFLGYHYAAFAELASGDIVYALLWGLRFDLAAAAFFSLLVVLLCLLPAARRRFGLWLLLALLIQTSLQIGDALYFADAGRHVSYEIRDALGDASGLFMTAVSQHGGFILLAYALLIGYAWLALRLLRHVVAGSKQWLPSFRGRVLVEVILVLLFTVLLLRGGIGGLPQSVNTAYKLGDAQLAVISMNGAYSVVYGLANARKEIRRVDVALPEDADVAGVMQSLYPQALVDAGGKAGKGYNLVFILLEGWPADRMSGYGHDRDTTPFYHSLMARSLTPRGVLAGGVRTTEGIFATFCSQQNPLGKSVAQTSLQHRPYHCLPQILRQQGYRTAFFQGSHKETSGTGAFAQSLGFSESYAREDMAETRYAFNYWGAQDPDIYDFVLARLDRLPQPFLIGVNTNSTHDIQLPEGIEAVFGQENRQQQYDSVLRFADDALREFFDKARSKPWFDNTVFVLMSDHTGGKHRTTAARYFIPGLIHAEGIIAPRRLPRYVSQRDFAPAVLELLGLPPSPSFAGKSLLRDDEPPYFADYFDAGILGWVSGDRVVETGISDPARISCYAIGGDLSDLQARDCDAQDRQYSLQSLVFSHYSQQKLFAGDTANFRAFGQSQDLNQAGDKRDQEE